jgi:hypothetical protein
MSQKEVTKEKKFKHLSHIKLLGMRNEATPNSVLNCFGMRNEATPDSA